MALPTMCDLFSCMKVGGDKEKWLHRSPVQVSHLHRVTWCVCMCVGLPVSPVCPADVTMMTTMMLLLLFWSHFIADQRTRSHLSNHRR